MILARLAYRSLAIVLTYQSLSMYDRFRACRCDNRFGALSRGAHLSLSHAFLGRFAL